MTTYKKRKTCRYKKAEEFSTLCGVKTCLIVYGPTKATDEVISEPELWPRDETKVREIIRKYRNTVSNSCKKETHIETFVNLSRKEKEMEKKNKIRVKNVKRKKNDNNIIKYPCWDEKLDKCSQDELRGILFSVENKLNEGDENKKFVKDFFGKQLWKEKDGKRVMIDEAELEEEEDDEDAVEIAEASTS